MKKYVLPLAAVLLIVSLPVYAARTAVLPLQNETRTVYQVYPGDSNGKVVAFAGYEGTIPTDLITVVPGILSIIPGQNWENYLRIAQEGLPYSIKNVTMVKTTPQLNQCVDLYPAGSVGQGGTPNVRLWWPLMYEVPGTTWKLTILYGTTWPYDDDGLDGPNPPSYVHTEEWTWTVDANLEQIEQLLALFREVPFGTDEVPLISDEELYVNLLAQVNDIRTATLPLDIQMAIANFEMTVMDACIVDSPQYPNPTGNGTGIANSRENPACCKLLVDAEYVGRKLGALQPGK